MEDQKAEERSSFVGELVDDFSAIYANNFHFEISTWDLKVLLGQLSLVKTPTIEWHTALTMPWAAAKILSYMLSLNISMYESNNGKIPIDKNVIPPAPDPPTGEHDTPQNRAFYDRAILLYQKLLVE